MTTRELGVAPAKICAQGVVKHFGVRDSVEALGPCDIEVADGEFVCIVGPSGCGKSTFLRIVAGLATPTAGVIDLFPRGEGEPCAMVFQDYAIFPWKRVLGNVRVGLDVAGVPRREANERSLQWLRRLGLSEFASAWPHTLSGGMRQRVSIARALAVEPEILLMDEPFAALDAQLRSVLQEELLALWESDRRTVVFVTHSLEEALLLGDRVVVMSARPGQVVANFAVPFERPRLSEIRGTAAFAELQQEIWEVLRTEVDRTLAAQRAYTPTRKRSRLRN